MHLLVEMLEDARGRRSVRTALSLHGLINKRGEDLHELASARSRRVDVQGVGASYRDLAQLVLIASDGFDEEWFQSALVDGLRDALLESPEEEIERGGLLALFEHGERLADEQGAVLDQLIGAAMTRLRRRAQHTSVRVERIELTDYRGVDQIRFEFPSSQTTVLVGTNGSGKTTLLDATALLLSHLEAGITRAPRRARVFTDMDVMNGRDLAKAAVRVEIAGVCVAWSLAHARGGEPLAAAEVREDLFDSSLSGKVAAIQDQIAKGDICLPLVVYYPVNRAVLDIPLRIRTQHAFDPLEAYDRALFGDRRNFRLFFEWFRGREDLENEIRIHDSAHRDHQLEAVRRAIESLMPGFSNLRVQRSPLGMIVKKGEGTLFVDQLSDGEKCLLAMTGDLARRLAMANPYMDDPLQGGGVILIDEIELHLHPSWQRQVIPALERTFPNCQFIVTTHSPAVIGHVHPESLFLLKPDATGIRAEKPSVSFGLDANRVLLEIMGVDERPHDIKVRLELIYTLLGNGKLQEARTEIEKLEAEMGSDPELTRASAIIRRKEAIGR